MKRMRCFAVGLIAVLLLLAGCAERREQAPVAAPTLPPPPSSPTEVVKPTLPLSSSEFEDVKRELLKAGILNEDTPVYRLGEIAEAKGSRFVLEEFFWRDGSVVIRFRFFGEKKRDERGWLWVHRVRLIIDDQRWLQIRYNSREEGNDYWAIYAFPRYAFYTASRLIPDSHKDHVLVLINIKDTCRRSGVEGVKPGDVAFIITERDISRR